MAITPQAGYKIDPTNPNAVIKDTAGAMPGSVASFQNQPSINYGAINSQNTQAQPVINLTPKPDNTNYQGMINGATAQAMSYQQPASTPTEQPKQTPATSIQDYIASLSQIKQPSATDTYSSLYDQSGLAGQKEDLVAKAKVTAEAQGRLNNISSQLQALNTEAQAVPIALQQDSIGRGRTESGIAPLQADELRKIALRALPLQAQGAIVQAEVANAQGQQQLAQDLYQQAETHLDKVFQLQMADLSNKYEFQTNLIDKVYEFADRQEQRQLATLKDQADKDYQTQRDTVAYNRQVEQDKIDYQRDLAKINLQNSNKTPEAPTVKTINGVDKQWNPQTGTWDNIAGGGSNPTIGSVVNPTTGKVDPRSQISNIINQTGAKTDDKLKLTGAVISAVQGFAENNLTGSIKGLGVGSMVPSLFLGQAGTQNRTDLSALEGTVESWMTGASVSEDQQKRIKDELIPKKGDTDGQVRKKINALANFMMNYAAGSLSTQGVSWTPEKIDFFAPVVITSPDGQEWQ